MGYLSSCKADSSVHTSNSHYPIKIQEFNYQDLELATNNFSDSKLLGRGSHGLVYKALLSTGRHVAVKKPSFPDPSGTTLNEVDNEIDILSTLRSPGLVNLLGFTPTSQSPGPHTNRLLVVEFMSNGTLYDVLHSKSRPPPNWGRRIRLALQTAKAIDTLHSSTPPVIHRDIKSANVLIDRNFNARLGDFGLALRCGDGTGHLSTPPAGTMGYLDPCYTTPDFLSTKTDVFSFGILLLEIISGRKAIDLAYSPASIVDWAIPLIRRRKLLTVYDPRTVPPKDALVRQMLALLAAKCVRTCRERRPSMKQVVACLEELSKLVPVPSWKNGLATNPCMAAGGTVVREGGGGSRAGVSCSKNDGGNNKIRAVSSSKNKKDDDGGNKIGRGRGRESDAAVGLGGGSRRVLSDLGFRSNLMELMSGRNGESSFRLEDDGGAAEGEEYWRRFGKRTSSSCRFEI